MIDSTKKQEAAFWAKVDKDGPDGCWLWKGPHDTLFGFAYFCCGKSRRGRMPAATVAWELCNGRTAWQHVTRGCGRAGCVNPEHAVLRDYWPDVPPTTHKRRVPTPADVTYMRELADKGYSVRAIGAVSGWSPATAHRAIVSGRAKG